MGNYEFTSVFRDESARDTRLDVANVARPDGRTERHYRLLIGREGRGVVVVARSPRGLLLTSSFRPAADRVLVELPRGLVDAGIAGEESFLSAGERELEEETGYRSERSLVLGEFVVDSAVYPLRVGVVLCHVDVAVAPGATDGEVDEVWWATDDEVEEAIVAGDICDGISLAAWAMVRAVERGGLRAGE